MTSADPSPNSVEEASVVGLVASVAAVGAIAAVWS